MVGFASEEAGEDYFIFCDFAAFANDVAHVVSLRYDGFMDDTWFLDGRNVTMLARYMADRHDYSKHDIVEVFERPWDYDSTWSEYCRTSEALRVAGRRVRKGRLRGA